LSRRGERPPPETLATLPVAVDAMGGDKAPGEVVEGARRAAEQHGVKVVLVGPPEQVGDTLGLDLVPCSEVIGMDEDPAGGVRRKKDSSLVRAAELVRDGKASAMVSAGNTGATMAAALLRRHEARGVVFRLGVLPASFDGDSRGDIRAKPRMRDLEFVDTKIDGVEAVDPGIVAGGGELDARMDAN